MTRWIPLLLATVMLAGCGSPNGDGTAVSIAAANGSATLDSGGQVKIDTPAFKGAFVIPKVDLTADNFDIDGVHLYPGSRIGAVDVAAGKRRSDGRVAVRFDSPAEVSVVRGWLAQQFAKAGKEVSVQGDRLRGRTDDQEFTIDLTAAGAHTAGKVIIE
jgi:hypothetical protein